MSLAICAIFRNEAPYLREWIEFHRITGVERFHLYQNRSEDDWDSVLKPYIEAGIADVTEWPSSPPCQLEAYRHFLERNRGQNRWVAFIDCDEFLFSPTHANTEDAIAAVASPGWGALGVNWMCFGSGGQEHRAHAPVIERFTLRPRDDFSPNRHIKSIVRMDRVESTGGNPHCFNVKGGTFAESGRAIHGPFSAPPCHAELRINHYHTKSREEYLRRIARGQATGSPEAAA